jgi:hypothetical protein
MKAKHDIAPNLVVVEFRATICCPQPNKATRIRRGLNEKMETSPSAAEQS